MMTAQNPRLLRCLAGETLDRPPIWFMRQAGRFLPEYQALRAQSLDVIAFCRNTQRALDVTVHLLHRFAFDKASRASKVIQGALNPLLVRAWGLPLKQRVDEMLLAWGDWPYIFNLGHGILPDTPIDHDQRVVDRVTGYRQ